MANVIFLFTDFRLDGFYVGQMHAAIHAHSVPGAEPAIVDLMHDASAHDPKSAAYLLAALTPALPAGAIVVGVVDPGVGGERIPVIIESAGRLFIGPGNGLFELVMRRDTDSRLHRIAWKPDKLSASFHGRDLFAPVAAKCASEAVWPRDLATPLPQSTLLPGTDWPDDFAAVVHIDGFGNAIIGIRADKLAAGLSISVGGVKIRKARTFSDVPAGQAFWYENSIGLIEIAVNQGRASDVLSLNIGSSIGLV